MSYVCSVPVMTTQQFPSQAHLRTLCIWMTSGPDALDEPKMYGVPKRGRRNYSLRCLRQLTERLQLSDEYHDMRYRAPGGRPLSVTLDPELRTELYRQCRRHGYVLRAGTDVTPLSSTRMHIISLLSWGHTNISAGALLGVRKQTVGHALRTARETTGTLTTTELVSYAFRHGWLPSHEELGELYPGSDLRELRASLYPGEES